MQNETVTLKLPRALLTDAEIHARAQGVSVGELVRQLLHKETTAYSHKPPKIKSSEKTKLRALFSDAGDWLDLKRRLMKRNYSLRAMGTGLAIYTSARGHHVCNTATVGFPYKTLVKKFGGPMPGHPHGLKWVKKKPEIVEDFDVIERNR